VIDVSTNSVSSSNARFRLTMASVSPSHAWKRHVVDDQYDDAHDDNRDNEYDNERIDSLRYNTILVKSLNILVVTLRHSCVS